MGGRFQTFSKDNGFAKFDRMVDQKMRIA